jgi:hypothetical protein
MNPNNIKKSKNLLKYASGTSGINYSAARKRAMKMINYTRKAVKK